jgi:hypothetical protein
LGGDFVLHLEKLYRMNFNLKSLAGIKAWLAANAALTNAPTVSSAAAGTASVRPYKVYSALITQTGTAAPVVTVLENSIGPIVWTRAGVGDYRGTLTGAFPDGKTSLYLNENSGNKITLVWQTANNVQLGTDTSGETPTDGILNRTTVEIRVYP